MWSIYNYTFIYWERFWNFFLDIWTANTNIISFFQRVLLLFLFPICVYLMVHSTEIVVRHDSQRSKSMWFQLCYYDSLVTHTCSILFTPKTTCHSKKKILFEWMIPIYLILFNSELLYSKFFTQFFFIYSN